MFRCEDPSDFYPESETRYQYLTESAWITVYEGKLTLTYEGPNGGEYRVSWLEDDRRCVKN